MQKLSTFFRTVALSSVSPQYYTDVLKAKMGFSLKYFLLLNLIVAAVTMVRLMVPVAAFDVGKTADEVAKVYPQDLQISVAKGKVSINKPLPYVVPIPGEVKKLSTEHEDTRNMTALVTFDSDKNIQGIKDFLDSNSFATVTETTVYYREDMDTNEVKAVPIPEDIEPFTFDAQVIQRAKQAILDKPFIKNRWYVGVLGVGLLIFLYPLMLAWRFATVIWYSVLAFIAVNIFKNVFFHGQKFTFEKVVQVTMHSLTPVIIAAYALDLLGIPFVLSGWLYLLAYLIWTVVALAVASQTSPQSKKHK